MADVHTPAQRRKNMSAIRTKHTQAEVKVAQLLTSMQLKFESQARLVGAKIDFYVPEYRTAMLVHGCFWHGHDCHLFKVPATRTDFWLTKINKNRRRDNDVANDLAQVNVKQLIIWECALRGRGRLEEAELIDRIEEFLLSEQVAAQISMRGFETRPSEHNKE